MAARSRLASESPDPLDIRFKPVRMRTLTGRMAPPSSPDAIHRVRKEFLEMRGFSPTLPQAARLFDLAQEDCSQILTLLLAEGFIHQTADGRFRRVTN